MGKKYLLINGKQIEIDPQNPELKKKFGESILTSMIQKLANKDAEEDQKIGFGAVIEYSSGSETMVGKVTSYNKRTNKLVVSKAIGKSRAGGFSFSMSDTEEVGVGKIIRRLPV